jgi:hypothetical protein
MLRALIFLPAADAVAAGAVCVEYATTAGYQLQGVVIGRWQDILDLVHRDEAEVVVVADRSHIPTDRTPRIEIVAEENLPVPVAVRAAAGRRPQILA